MALWDVTWPLHGVTWRYIAAATGGGGVVVVVVVSVTLTERYRALQSVTERYRSCPSRAHCGARSERTEPPPPSDGSARDLRQNVEFSQIRGHVILRHPPRAVRRLEPPLCPPAYTGDGSRVVRYTHIPTTVGLCPNRTPPFSTCAGHANVVARLRRVPDLTGDTPCNSSAPSNQTPSHASVNGTSTLWASHHLPSTTPVRAALGGRVGPGRCTRKVPPTQARAVTRCSSTV